MSANIHFQKYMNFRIHASLKDDTFFLDCDLYNSCDQENGISSTQRGKNLDAAIGHVAIQLRIAWDQIYWDVNSMMENFMRKN